MAKHIGQPLLHDPISGQRNVFIDGVARVARLSSSIATAGLISRQPCARASSAPKRPISSKAAGRNRPRMRRLTCCSCASCSSMRRQSESSAAGVRGRAVELARKRPDAGADRKEKRADFIVQIARNVATFFVLHMNHALHETMVFIVEPFERRRQRIDAIRDRDQFRRPAGREAHVMIAALETERDLRPIRKPAAMSATRQEK